MQKTHLIQDCFPKDTKNSKPRKKTMNPIKKGPRPSQTPHQRDTQMTGKQMKRCSVSSSSGNGNETMRFHCTPIRAAKPRALTTPSAGEDGSSGSPLHCWREGRGAATVEGSWVVSYQTEQTRGTQQSRSLLFTQRS